MLYLLYLNILLIISYLTGHGIISLLPTSISKTNTRFFAKIFVGFFSLVVLYSIFKTGGKTINIILILYAFLLYRIEKKQVITIKRTDHFSEIKNDLINYIYSLPFLLIFFAWQYYFIYQTETSFPTVVEWDNRFTADLAMFLNYSGKETLTWDHIFTHELGNSPYHYIESWCVAFTAFLFNTNYWLILQLIIIPMLQYLLIRGIWSIFEFKTINIKYKVLSILFIFISACYLPAFSKSPLFQYTYTWFYGFNAMDEPWFFKITIAYLLLICSTLFLLQKKYRSALITILVLPIFSINIAPSILSVTFLFLLIITLNNKNIHNLKLLVYPIITGVFILLFYKLLGAQQVVEIPKASNILKTSFENISTSRTDTIIFFEKIISAALLYLPYLLLIFINIRFLKDVKKDNSSLNFFYRLLILFLIILIPTGVSIWYVLRNTYGAWELFYSSFLPITNYTIFITIYIILTSIKKGKWHKTINYTLVGAITVFVISKSIHKSVNYKKEYEQLYTKEFITSVKALTNGVNTMGIKIQDIKEFKKRQILYNPFLNLSARYLNNIFDAYSLVNVSFEKINPDTLKNVIHKQQVLSSPYIKFKKEELKKNPNLTDDEILIIFIKKFKIDYIITNTNCQLQEVLKPFVIKIIDNKASNDRFILINHNTKA